MRQITVEPINTDQTDEISKQALVVLEDARGLAIKSQEGYDGAGSLLQNIKSRVKSIDSIRKSIVKPLDEARAKVQDLFRPILEHYEEAEKIVKKGMLIYADEQERIRKAEEDKLQKEAEKKRQEAEAKAEEARKQAEEAQRKAEEARKAGDEEAARKAEAEAAKQEAKAEKQEEKASQVVAPTLAPRVEQAKGVHFTEKWSAEVVDFEKLPNEYKLPDMPKLNKVAQAMKGALNVPGVVFKKEKIVSSRSSNE